jgi:small subunit ribosomal protein S1
MELQNVKVPGIGTVQWEDEDAAFGQEDRSGDFANLLDDQENGSAIREGTIVKGRVVRLTDDSVIVDIGHKAEGEVPLSEFVTMEGQSRRYHRSIPRPV